MTCPHEHRVPVSKDLDDKFDGTFWRCVDCGHIAKEPAPREVSQ